MKTPVYIVVASSLSAQQREQIHEIVKAKSNGWWHHMPNVWIVRGGTVASWTDSWTSVVEPGRAAGLVFKLDNGTPEGWSGYAEQKMYDWIQDIWFKD